MDIDYTEFVKRRKKYKHRVNLAKKLRTSLQILSYP